LANLIKLDLWLYFLFWGVGFVGMQMFLYRLRHQFEGEWIRIGRPGLFSNNGIRGSLALLGYIWRREYSQLENRRLTSFGNFVRFVTFGFFVVFALTIAVFVLSPTKFTKVSNQSTDPTLASGTPPAGQESRHP
jgi:hypothetical protein